MNNCNKIFLGIFIVLFFMEFPTTTNIVFANNQNSILTTVATIAYDDWKENYVVPVSDKRSRVINPQDNNVTVSEGIGYGLLFSAAADDETTFEELWQYAKQYLNKNGLMHWKINANGKIIGKGSATDADQDIAYALLLADKKWPQKHYLEDAKRMINAIRKHEVTSTNLLLPGDSWTWTKQPPLNPSYIALSYYQEFAAATKDPSWGKIALANLQFLNQVANKDTGLTPDWVNQNGTIKNHENKFGYDAIRIPIRLYPFYMRSNNPTAGMILQKEYDFFANEGINTLVAGYTITGRPLVSHLTSAYLASFAMIGYMHPTSNFSVDLLERLIHDPTPDYYSSSLKVWVLLTITGKL